MSSNKIVIIVLIIIVGIFVFFVTMGSLAVEKPKASKETSAKEYAKKKPPAWSGFIKSALGYFAETVELSCPNKPPANSNFICERLPLDKKINIKANKDVSFRTVNLELRKGKAKIKYRDKTKDAKDLEFDKQDFDLPDNEYRKPRENSIVVLEKGGNLEIECVGDDPCEVAQK